MRWFIAVIVGMMFMASFARAQDTPVDPPEFSELTLLVAASPGGGYDRTAQSLRTALIKEGLVSEINVRYSPGAGGLIGLAQFVEAAPDDPPTLLISGRTALGATLHNRSMVSLQDAEPLARLVSPSITVIVPSDSKIESMGQLADIVSQEPDLISWYGGSVGSFDEVVVRSIVSALGPSGEQVDFNAIPGGGDRIIEELEKGDLTVGVSSFEEAIEAVESGRVRLLAVTAEGEGFESAAPTFETLGIPLEEKDWRGAFAHPSTSAVNIETLSDLISQVVRSESWKEELRERYWTDVYLSGQEFRDFIEADWETIQTRSEIVNSDRTQSAKAENILERRQRIQRLGAIAIGGLIVLIGALAWVYRRQRKKWLETFDEFTEESRLMQEKLDKSHGDMGAHINGEFDKWNLTDAENEIGWMLLKGLSFKEIAIARGRSERTVRQQAQSIYAKSSLQSRSDLAAHFLEDFVFGAAETQ